MLGVFEGWIMFDFHPVLNIDRVSSNPFLVPKKSNECGFNKNRVTKGQNPVDSNEKSNVNFKSHEEL